MDDELKRPIVHFLEVVGTPIQAASEAGRRGIPVVIGWHSEVDNTTLLFAHKRFSTEVDLWFVQSKETERPGYLYQRYMDMLPSYAAAPNEDY